MFPQPPLVILTPPSQKYGRPNEATPSKWTSGYTDYNAPLNVEGTSSAPVRETTSKDDVLSAPPVAPNGETSDAMVVDEAAAPATNGDAGVDGKKRKSKHDGETPEERAERKRRKKEKKEKKEKRKSGSKKEESDESE